MSRNVRVCALSPYKFKGDPNLDFSQCLHDVIAYWDELLENAFALRPDLIVLPEACDRPSAYSIDRRLAYYEYRGNRVRDHLMAQAVKHHCNIAYSAARQTEDGTFRNSTQFLSRRGGIDGIYNKNHLVIGEYTDGHILYGNSAPIIETDFGRVGGVICFDYYFDALRTQYMESRPELLVFSGNLHGGFLRQNWAYSCQSYLVASVPVEHGGGSILNPVGKVLVESVNHRPFIACADIDLDYRVLHWDENLPKLLDAQRKYGPDLHICDPDSHLGVLLLTYSGDRTTLQDIMKEYQLETWDEYYARSGTARELPGRKEK